ncbi:MAG: hypothetical protein AAF740_07430 [Bacteroidota bacterium]
MKRLVRWSVAKFRSEQTVPEEIDVVLKSGGVFHGQVLARGESLNLKIRGRKFTFAWETISEIVEGKTSDF